MPIDASLLTPDARRAANLQLAVAAGASDLGPREVDARPTVVEQAKGALMLHYGIDSHQALAVLVGWARTSRTPVVQIAHALLRGICEGNPQTEVRQRELLRWLEAQLRTAPSRSWTGP